MNVVINGVEFRDVDFTDADVAEAYERRLHEFQKLSQQKPTNLAAFIREVCDLVSDWADDMFYEGAGDEILGGKASLTVASSAAHDIIAAFGRAFDEYQEVMVAMGDEINAQNRTRGTRKERRAAGREQRKKNRNNQPKALHASTSDRYNPDRVER